MICTFKCWQNRCFELTDEGASALAHCHELTHLSIPRTDAADITVREIARNCAYLQHVDVGCVENVTDDGVMFLVQTCPHIHTLAIYSTSITGASLLCVAKHCTQLQHLDMEYA